jgi:glycosyltransferase involved in cell wall biosynthesis
VAKVLWVSDSLRIPFVGQSIVTRNILKRLKNKHEVIQLGFGEKEVTDTRPETKEIEPDLKVIDYMRSDMTNIEKTTNVIKEVKPDVLVFSHDPWLYPLVGQMKATFPAMKQVGYVTIDGEPPYWKWYDLLKPYDLLVSPAEYGAKVLKHRWVDLDIKVIPYGIEHEHFHYPKNGKEDLRNQLFQATQGRIDMRSRFVGIFVGANQDRKNLGLQYEAWKRFEKGKSDVMFLMFTHSAALKEQVGVYDLGAFTHDTHSLVVIPQEQPINLISSCMAASDVLLHPSSGEGFGLTLCEALACGTPPILPHFAGVTDFCTEANSYASPYILHVGGYHVHRAVSSFADYAACIERAYTNRDELQKKAEQGVKDAAKYTWDACVDGWDQAINEVLKYPTDSIRATRVV